MTRPADLPPPDWTDLAARTLACCLDLAACSETPGQITRTFLSAPMRSAHARLDVWAAALGLETRVDAAGNWHALRRSANPDARTLLIGSHLDSVPDAGAYDGVLGVVLGLSLLEAVQDAALPYHIEVVGFSEEEGVRFGVPFIGSRALIGTAAALLDLADAQGVTVAQAIAGYGLDVAALAEAHFQNDVLGYLELHIEQGPVLEGLGLPLGAVAGTVGVERHTITFHGQAAHSGSTPMNVRKDALLAAAKLAQEIYTIAERHGGVCTIGSVKTLPGIVTSVVETCELTLDQRHLDAGALAAMWKDAQEVSQWFAGETGCTVSFGDIWNIEPILFHPELIEAAEASILERTPTTHRLPSGPLHDAAEVARAGVPTVMLFVQSLRGISHNKIEDTLEEHIELSVEALNGLTDRAMDWIRSQPET